MMFSSKAPANSMLLGEHSVVYGHPALACALNQWISIRWQTRNDQEIHIESALGNHQTTWDQLTLHPELRFVIHALKAFQAYRPPGVNMKIHSEFSSTIGLGSSAAVLAAILTGLNHLCATGLKREALWQIGKQVIVEIQGRGSATDLAASLFGGVVYFHPPTETDKPTIESIPVSMPLLLVYSGYKTPTAEVLAKVALDWRDRPQALQALYNAMGSTTLQSYQALKNKHWRQFYQSFETYQQLMAQLGVSDSVMNELVEQLRQCPQIRASKISGSGLGDCVLALGDLESTAQQSTNLLAECPAQSSLAEYLQLQLPISPKGAHLMTHSEQDT
ncbi:GHMP kinase [Thiomicrorhabdus sp.]|uniref:mevalonate kinase family protein n=1 Tax=Thiomicrorhabdus sp. TaxID=2039724 RepID=UPI0029C6EC63|nr:GHMP kinase [Thiomicrorhabdus sp.]